MDRGRTVDHRRVAVFAAVLIAGALVLPLALRSPDVAAALLILGLVARQRLRSWNARSGYVYLVHDPSSGRYKIGRTKNKPRRFKEFTKFPVEPRLIHSFWARDMFAAETELHREYAGSRKRGEWFELTQSQVDRIRHGRRKRSP